MDVDMLCPETLSLCSSGVIQHMCGNSQAQALGEVVWSSGGCWASRQQVLLNLNPSSAMKFTVYIRT